MIILRDMIESDIEDNVRWFTKETEWTYWDSPAEPFEVLSEEEERASWREYFDSLADMPKDVERLKLEIECDGQHIGWINSYKELAFYPMPAKGIAIGLILPKAEDRNRGAGTEALRQYIAYLQNCGHTHFYLETWSGNTAMLAVAKKLGFYEVSRKTGLYTADQKSYDALVLEYQP